MLDSRSYYLAGYYLIKPFNAHQKKDKILPEKFYSVSACLSEIYPNEKMLSWVKFHEKYIEKLKKELNINDQEIKQLTDIVNELFETKQMLWPNVFKDKIILKEFHSKWLKEISDIKMLSIALPELYIEKFLIDEKKSQNDEEMGIYRILSERIAFKDDDSVKGYEIAGYDYGSFHSFVCNDLEVDYQKKLGIQLNSNGLIDTQEDAIKATNYTMAESTGAEPVNWYPWLVCEHNMP